MNVLQDKEIHQSLFYVASDFDAAMLLNYSAQDQFPAFIAKILTHGNFLNSHDENSHWHSN